MNVIPQIVPGRYIGADNTEKIVTPANGTDFSLEEAQGFVKGLVEVVGWLADGFIVLGNEESRLLDQPINAKVSLTLGYAVYGDCLVCKDEMFK